MAIAGLLIGTLVIAAPAAGQTPGPAATAAAAWAWIVVRDGSANLVRSPGKNSGNSTGGLNYVDHLGTGTYLLTLNGVQAAQGNVLVSPLGSAPKICEPADWTMAASAELINVNCFTRAGSPVDATFILNWLTASGTGGRLAYGLNFSPTSNCGGPSEQYDSMGGTISTCPAVNNVAFWKIPGLGSSAGTVQVTPNAHRADVGGLTAGICDLVAFGLEIDPNTLVADEWLDVKCFETDGSSQIYREHDAWFMQALGMKGITRTNVAYVFANRPGTTSYTPDAAFNYSSAGGANTVTRLGVGSYRVSLGGMPRGGSAQVTAYLGSTTAAMRHCFVSGIETSTLPQRVGVLCVAKNGTLVDTKFTLAYAR